MAIIEQQKPETFPVTFNIRKQRVWDLLCCGMESGSYGSFTVVGYHPGEVLEHQDCNYAHIDTPFLGGAILMKDKYGDEETVYRLTLDALKRGLTIMGENYSHLMAEFLAENEDVIVGDAFIQCALLGEIRYG